MKKYLKNRFGLKNYTKNDYGREYYAAFREQIVKKRLLSDPFNTIARDKRSGHRQGIKKGKWPDSPCTITAEALRRVWHKQHEKCALTGWPITLARTTRTTGCVPGGQATIDRIDNTHGYTDIDGRHNWNFVGYDCNAARGNMTREEFFLMCRAVVKYHLLRKPCVFHPET